MQYNDFFLLYSDPNEIKKLRERERYAQNRKEILQRQRQTREQNKNSTLPDGINTIILDTPATRCEPNQSESNDYYWYSTEFFLKLNCMPQLV